MEGVNLKKYNIAVLGATGAVGEEVLRILQKRKFPISVIKLLASDNSLGKSAVYKNKDVPVDVLDKHSFKGVDIAFFCSGKAVSSEFANVATESGAVVIDASSCFRKDGSVPLIVPEINKDDMALYKNKGIIASPSCSAIATALALYPIHKEYGIKRAVASIFHPVSRLGVAAVEEMVRQAKAWFEFRYNEITPAIVSKKMAFNSIPSMSEISDDIDIERDEDVADEIAKIIHTPISVSATSALVPIFRGHAESINIVTAQHFEIDDIENILNRAKGCKIVDNKEKLEYPTAIDVVEKEDVYFSKIRRDATSENGLNMWVLADNLKKGSALNMIQIAEILTKEYL
jgi:aspartate-semialdehyde dehydrogenase